MFEANLIPDDDLHLPVLVVEGDFTLHEKPLVDKLVVEATSGNIVGVILDLSGITYIDSAGLMVVVALYHRLARDHHPMATVTAANRYPAAKLTQLGLTRLPQFYAFGSITEAKQALTRRLRRGEEAERGHAR